MDVSLDSGGVRLETQSLAAILMGGVAFETPASYDTATASAAEGGEFTLAADHAQAMKIPYGTPLTVLLRFRQSVRGLAVGAPIDFRGTEIGQVRSISLTFDSTAGDFSTSVWVDIYSDRIAPAPDAGPDADNRVHRVARVADLVRRGLRAQLRTGSLLTGQRYVGIEFFPGMPAAHMDLTAEMLELPTVPGDQEELFQRVQSILSKLDKVPFNSLGQDAHRTLGSLDTSLKQLEMLMRRTDNDVLPEIAASLAEMRRTLEAVRGVVAEDSPLQQDIRDALRGVVEATRSMKSLTDGLGQRPESLLQGKKGTEQ